MSLLLVPVFLFLGFVVLDFAWATSDDRIVKVLAHRQQKQRTNPFRRAPPPDIYTVRVEGVTGWLSTTEDVHRRAIEEKQLSVSLLLGGITGRTYKVYFY